MPAEVETMAYAKSGGIPWHGLGVEVGDCTTSEQMVVAAGLDWTVAKGVLMGGPDAEHLEPWEGHVSLYRVEDGKVLGGATPEYEVWQNHEAFEFTDSLLADGSMFYETAISLRGGALVALLGRFPEDGRVADDTFRRYMLVTTGHDAGHSARGRAVNTRVVCMNTLTMAWGEKAPVEFSIRHTKGLHERLDQAREAMAITTEAHRRMEAFLQKAAVTAVSQPKFDAIVEEIFGKPDDRGPRVKGNVQRFLTIAGAETMRNGETAYSVINAITGYADHVRSGMPTDKWTLKRMERRFQATTIGTGMNFKNRAINVVREAVKI